MDVSEDTESRLLRINSRFKQPNESNTNFTFLYTGANLVRMQLVKLTCARMFANIYPPYNTINLDGTLYTIPTGMYTAEQLASEVTSVVVGMTCTLNANNKFSLTGSGVMAPTRLSTLLMGFPDNLFYLPFPNNPNNPNYELEATSPPSLAGPDPIYIESTDLALSNCFDHDNSNSGSIPLVWSVNCSTVPYGFTIGWESNDAELNRIDVKNSTFSNRTFHIKLTDQYGHVLVLPETAHVDLIFKVFYQTNK